MCMENVNEKLLGAHFFLCASTTVIYALFMLDYILLCGMNDMQFNANLAKQTLQPHGAEVPGTTEFINWSHVPKSMRTSRIYNYHEHYPSCELCGQAGWCLCQTSWFARRYYEPTQQSLFNAQV